MRTLHDWQGPVRPRSLAPGLGKILSEVTATLEGAKPTIIHNRNTIMNERKRHCISQPLKKVCERSSVAQGSLPYCSVVG